MMTRAIASILLIVGCASLAQAHPTEEGDSRCHMHKETGALHCPQRQETEEKREPRAPARRFVYYSTCAEAWRAGVAPIWKDQPGYRPELDGDHDGWACEPIRGRRR